MHFHFSSLLVVTDLTLPMSVLAARAHANVEIVNVEWLRDKVKGTQTIDTTQPSTTQQDTHHDPILSGTSKDKKRSRKEVSPSSELSDLDAPYDLEEPPLKKAKDGQKAKSSSLRIPVDEMCSLAGDTFSFHNFDHH